MGSEMGMQIRTNRDAWRAVHEALADGLSRVEVSERTGLSYGMVNIYAAQSSPARTIRKIQRTHAGAKRCVDCGVACALSSRRCHRCDMARVKASVAGREENLRAWAMRHGRVPTVGEARIILGVGRSRAGDVVQRAFGPDRRGGHERRVSYRGWPDGAPDVPREDMAEHLRQVGRDLAARRPRVAGRWV